VVVTEVTADLILRGPLFVAFDHACEELFVAIVDA